ncbi:hypothetical protein MNBD_PLANCTO03-2009 [hydrothermal vent metagenome]|uniref:Sulfatase-modifying factor enzyme-like domain-containing protein n=1 Tax=hydrothermal vent metagenome TaxID=652676 RepID=A0A3B1DI54_9ZZZZ
MLDNSIIRSLGLFAGLGLAVGTALAQTSSIVWKEIGDPGNQPWEDDRYPFLKFNGRGQVDHRYRMAETELSLNQWVEFVRAYGPHADDPLDRRLIGNFIRFSYQDGELVYEVASGFENFPAQMSWRMAARYTNWLHNDRVNEAWAFESGAYDTSTFTRNDDGSYNDQDTRSPDARYWIPSMDEWMKAAYYDPDRFGEGLGGWWEQADGSDEALIAGFPGSGGETNASMAWDNWYSDTYDVGLYTDSRSPWGLLDMSGGMREFTEEMLEPNSRRHRHTKGASLFDDPSFYGAMDWIGSETWLIPTDGLDFAGIRLASAIPGPPTLLLVSGVFFWINPRKRR